MPFQSLLFLVGMVLSYPMQAQLGTSLFQDPFDGPSDLWQPISIENGAGSFASSNGTMNITTEAGMAYGTFYNQPFAGHFEVEVSFDTDHGVALALLKDING